MIKNLVSIVKNTLTDHTDSVEIAKVCDYYNVEYDVDIMPLFRSIFEKSLDEKFYIDFDDMIYFPVIYKMKFPQFDWVLVDESQDLNRAQIELVLSCVKKPNGRVVAVGDPHQSIYGFRGADTEAMNRIHFAINAKKLPLSVCYRCPSSHIKLAKEIVPQIESFIDNGEGIILKINESNFIDNVKDEKNPLVLCRINAPLVKYALSLISKGYRAMIKGKDIGQNLQTIIKNLDGENMNDLQISLDSWESKEIEKLSRRNSPKSARQLVNDKAECLKILMDECNSKECIINKIEKLFSDESIQGIQLSTVHRAKGLEADSVYIVEPQLLPLQFENMKDWEKEQEQNICYVAYTRSKNKLVFVNKD
jgi:superfamily I DNA/RNA helicase